MDLLIQVRPPSLPVSSWVSVCVFIFDVFSNAIEGEEGRGNGLVGNQTDSSLLPSLPPTHSGTCSTWTTTATSAPTPTTTSCTDPSSCSLVGCTTPSSKVRPHSLPPSLPDDNELHRSILMLFGGMYDSFFQCPPSISASLLQLQSSVRFTNSHPYLPPSLPP